MEHYLVYNTLSGEVISRGQGPFGSSALVKLIDGLAVMVVPQEVVQTLGPIDLVGLKAAVSAQVDGAAEAFRLRFVTAGAGQMLTYTTKAAEAAAYLIDDEAPVPFLTAEASARDMTVAALASEVSARSAEWTIIGSRIEAARMGAKSDISAATNVAEIAAAIAIDWTALVNA